MQVDSAPALACAGFHLRHLTAGDAEAIFAYASLPEVKQHTSSTITTLADVTAMIERCLAPDPASPVNFALCADASAEGDARLVGLIGFHTVSPLNRSAEITYSLHPAVWGRGLATAACRAALVWGFGEQRWVRIQATVLPENEASLKILASCGFALEGTVRNFRIVRGAPRDYLLYAITPP